MHDQGRHVPQEWYTNPTAGLSRWWLETKPGPAPKQRTLPDTQGRSEASSEDCLDLERKQSCPKPGPVNSALKRGATTRPQMVLEKHLQFSYKTHGPSLHLPTQRD